MCACVLVTCGCGSCHKDQPPCGQRLSDQPGEKERENSARAAFRLHGHGLVDGLTGLEEIAVGRGEYGAKAKQEKKSAGRRNGHPVKEDE